MRVPRSGSEQLLARFASECLLRSLLGFQKQWEQFKNRDFLGIGRTHTQSRFLYVLGEMSFKTDLFPIKIYSAAEFSQPAHQSVLLTTVSGQLLF